MINREYINSLIERLASHVEDKRNTAFARSTMTEIIGELRSGNLAAPVSPVPLDSEIEDGELIASLIEGNRALKHAALATPKAVEVAPAAGAGQLSDEAHRMAAILFEAWQKAEPKHSITQYPESYKATFLDMARAALAARPSSPADGGAHVEARAAPDGWRLVPDEPTQEMVNAVRVGRLEPQSGVHQAQIQQTIRENYRKMLAAAPSEPAEWPLAKNADGGALALTDEQMNDIARKYFGAQQPTATVTLYQCREFARALLRASTKAGE